MAAWLSTSSVSRRLRDSAVQSTCWLTLWRDSVFLFTWPDPTTSTTQQP